MKDDLAKLNRDIHLRENILDYYKMQKDFSLIFKTFIKEIYCLFKIICID
jgi:hypothetical protein